MKEGRNAVKREAAEGNEGRNRINEDGRGGEGEIQSG